MKNKAMNVLLTTSMILGSASALAGNYQDKTTSEYNTAPQTTPTSRTQTKPMNDRSEMNNERGMDKTAAATDTWSDNNKMNRSTSMTNIKKAQKTLNEKGFEVGTVDGVIGQKTRSAIMDFQNEHDLTATGSLNQETLDKMDISPDFKKDDSDTYAE